MTQDEKKSTGLLNSATELRQLIIDNPDLPLLVFAGEDANSGGDYSIMSCSSVRAYVGEYLDCCQTVNDCRCYNDRDDFEEDLADALYNAHEEVWGNTDEGASWEEFVKEELSKYDPYWKKCIILIVNN